MDGAERVLKAPGSIEIPRGTPHTFRVVGDELVRTVVDHAPPGRYEDFIDRLYALAREGKTDDKGAPRNILQTAVVARPHLDEFALAKPPYAVQKALFALLAPHRPRSPASAERSLRRRRPLQEREEPRIDEAGRAHGWPGSMTSCSSFGSDGSQ